LFDIHNRYSEHVQILSINPINPQGRILSDISRFDVPFPVLEGRGSSIIRDYQIRALPAIYVIDKSGKVAAGGKFMTLTKLEETVKRLIASETDAIK
jgi:hypothetical protein